MEDNLKFEGNTGPYLQYTYARICSLLENKKNIDVEYNDIEINEDKWNLIWSISKFEENIIQAKVNNDPSIIAKYLLDLAADFNKFYAHEKIIDNNINYTEFKMGYAELASIILTENKKKMKIVDIFKKICNALGLTEAEFENNISEFFEIVSTNKLFTMLPQGYCDLKTRHMTKVVLDDEEEEVKF